ncbi:O-methylsterigmatocystin oxidoreductase [Leucoagaricus sp. SymC.cos]|nr:O-methylsterigmatocystin oxidoreductase [Leucoagaricus sp. SymC.cos]
MALFKIQDAVFVSICLLVHLSYRYRRRSTLPLPPGPRRWPIIGHALSIPMTHMSKAYKLMGEQLGTKIIHLEAFGQRIVVLNDIQMARDLMEKRSAIYSSRPHLNMLMDVVRINYLFSVMPYGEEWRNHRRLFQQYFAPKHIQREQERILAFVRKGLLPSLYESPKDFMQHIRTCVGGFATAIGYGIPIQRKNDPMVRLAVLAFEEALVEAATPGRFLVDIIPILRHVPVWFPGAGFKSQAKEWRSVLLRARDEPYRATITAMHNGNAPVSFVSESLAHNSDRPDFKLQELHIKQTATQLYAAASETTASAATTFILAMLKFPEAQKRAQQEINVFIGRDRLPEFSDQPDLPYLSAVLKEVLRWNPPVPLGVPHRSTEDDTYSGYFIPKGSVVMANA